MKKNLIAIATIFITLVACNTSNKINTDEATTHHRIFRGKSSL